MKKELAALIENNIPDNYFLVEVQVVMLRNVPKVKVSIDSDTGIGIDECSTLSRLFAKLIDDSTIADDYELEVSSPGIGEPLKLERQYVKNVGRLVKITTAEGQVHKGKLLEVLPQTKIVLEAIIEQKKNKTEVKVMEIPFTDIKKTVVEVSFS